MNTDSMYLDYELYGNSDVRDEIYYDNGWKLLRRWYKETVTFASNTATLSYAGKGNCEVTGGVTGTVVGTTCTATVADGDHEVLYMLLVPQTTEIGAGVGFVTDREGVLVELNQQKQIDIFEGDGYTKVFTLSDTPSGTSNIKAYVNGLEDTDVTVTTTNVTFATAPRRKALVEIEYNLAVEYQEPVVALEYFEVSGTVETVPALVDLTVTENEEKTGYLNVNGAPLKVAGNKTYTVTLNKDLIESQDNILEEYRDKKFRLKVENPRDSSKEYLGVCHIDPDASLDYLNGTENIVIKCGDLYD